MNAIWKGIVCVAGLSVAASACVDFDSPATPEPAPEPAAPLGTAQEALSPTCITLQRPGASGTVFDALIASDPPRSTANFGASQSLTAGSVPPGMRDALLRFDLSGVPASSRITSAAGTLEVLLYDHDGVATIAHRATSAWTESTVTYQSFSCSFLPNVESSFPSAAQPPPPTPPPAPPLSPTSTDLRSVVQGWVDGAYANDGLLLERDLNYLTVYASSELPQVASRPKLDVCFTPPVDCAMQLDGSLCIGGLCQGGVCLLQESFGPATSYPVGSVPNAVATGDFNRDGKQDLVVANEGTSSDSVSVLLGNGDGTFQPAVSYPAGANPGAIAVGDFNKDGKQDLAVVDAGSTEVSVLLGNGDGTFQAPVSYFSGGGPLALAVGDFNNDGKQDLAVGNTADGNVGVLLGNGDGTFQPVVTFATGPGPFSIAVGDFNGDCNQDLAVTQQGAAGVAVLLGNGDGTFQAAVSYAAGTSPFTVAIGDFDGDGKQDLAVANNAGFTNNVHVLLGNGDGTFQPAATYTAGFSPYAIAVGDFNLDGKQDLAVTNDSSSEVSVLLGNGDGTFQAPTDYSTGSNPRSVAVGDFNLDGEQDLAVANSSSNNVTVLLNTSP
jgi:FG-GAP-like repeat/FG-GAP repeat